MKKTRFIAAILAGLWSSIAMQVSAQYGTDMTHLLTNPNFEEGTTGWTLDGGGSTIATAANYGYSGTTFMESWVWAPGPLSDRSWHQTIDLPNGIYAVKAMAHAVMQNDESLTPEGVSIFANEDMVPVTTTYTNPPKEYHVFTQVTDGSLTVGLNITSCNTNWVAWDNVRILHYSSAQTIEEAKIMSAKDEIMALIDKATTLSAEVFADAIAKAQDVYDNATDYDIIVEAINELQDTIDFFNAKAALKALIDQATTLPAEVFADAIAKAQDVYDTATDYNTIVEATNELQDTIDETISTGYFLKEGHLIVFADIEWSYPWESQRYGIRSVEFRDGVTFIGSAAFEGCENLTSITIPASVTSINDNAFMGCISLSTVTISEESKLTSIGGQAFRDCEKLISINIPASVTSIGMWAFMNCSSLTTISIPEESKLTSIGSQAFIGCKNLTSINIPTNVTQIEHGAFQSCISLSTVTIPENSKLTSIGGSAFCDCKSLSSITIPSGVTSIGDEAFRECHKLSSSITIPNGVTSIGFATFWNCSSLTTVNISEGSKLTLIGDWAFEGCANLSSITIPNGVTSIGQSAFCGCI